MQHQLDLARGNGILPWSHEAKEENEVDKGRRGEGRTIGEAKRIGRTI